MPFFTAPPPDPELLEILAAIGEPSEEELREQRISFAYGNGNGNTKDGVRKAARLMFHYPE